MATFIKMKFKISDAQTNINKYRLAANITEYHILSKFIFLRIITQKFMIKQLFHIKMYVKMSKIMFKIDVRTFL